MFSLQSDGAGRGEKESRLNWGEGAETGRWGPSCSCCLHGPGPEVRGWLLAVEERAERGAQDPPSLAERAGVPEGFGLG